MEVHEGVAVFARADLYARSGYLGQYTGGRIELDGNLDDTMRERVLRHELTHARQHRESGLGWAAWLAEYRRIERAVGYLNHPWEIEARKAEIA